jgi:AtzE family amidohydrolase
VSLGGADAATVADAVRRRTTTARAVVADALARIEKRDAELNCFTAVLADRALAEAGRVDRVVAAGGDPGPLAGVPFAVKNLFDVAGLVTLAGSIINRDRPPAARDAWAVRALARAGAVLVGALNMDEYAYGFTTVNSHYGPTHNPHDRARMAGGSSGGSAAAVAAGLVPVCLGSDTNGSIRVPASFCGVFGLKPTYGRLSRAGVALFSPSLDHVGPLARSVRDLACAFDALQGHDPDDPVSSARAPEPVSPQLAAGAAGLRVAVADGHFAAAAEPEALAAVADVAGALGARRRVSLPEVARARAAASLITASDGATLHLADLRSRPRDFDPRTRDRFLAGALVPAAAYVQAQRFRRWFRDRVRDVFRDTDVVITPTVPFVAPLLDQEHARIDGTDIPVRSHIGVFTQPFSFIGLPALSAPVVRPGRLPLGVQLVGAPYREAEILRVAATLEAAGLLAAPIAPASAS